MSQYDLFFTPPAAGISPTKPPFADAPALSSEEREEQYKALAGEVSECRLCQLSQTRTQTVFGEGSLDAGVMFIGEGPGHQEDLSGRPFVGPAGQLLTQMIEKGMGVPRSSVYIANLVKCRPTVDLAFKRDRPPEAGEVGACTPYLLRQIKLIQPKVIVAVGGPAVKFLLKTSIGITRLHGKWHEYEGIPVMPIYHPSYILRNGGDSSPLKKELWADIKLVMERLGWHIPS